MVLLKFLQASLFEIQVLTPEWAVKNLSNLITSLTVMFSSSEAKEN